MVMLSRQAFRSAENIKQAEHIAQPEDYSSTKNNVSLLEDMDVNEIVDQLDTAFWWLEEDAECELKTCNHYRAH